MKDRFGLEIAELIYELNEDGESYKVVGVKEREFPFDEVESLEIPDFYNGKPVTALADQYRDASGNQYSWGPEYYISFIIGKNVKEVEENFFWHFANIVEVFNKSALSLNMLEKNVCSRYDEVGPRALNVYTPTRGKSKLSTENGCVYYTDKENKIFVRYTGDAASLILPSGVTEIYKCAFFRCNTLQEILLPNGVKKIGEYAFFCCAGLKEIALPNGVAIIDENAFTNCNNLNKIVIPSSVTSIRENAFWHCKQLTSVYYTGSLADWCNIGIDRFWAGAEYYTNPLIHAKEFYIEDTLITDLVIPETVKVIKRYAFLGYKGLKSVVISNGETEIEDGAFNYCHNLTSVTLPDNVTPSGNYGRVFSSCSSLRYHEEDGLKYLGSKTNKYLYLYGASSKDITTAKIHDKCKIIGWLAFYECEKLTSAVIPDSVIRIEDSAFEKCRRLWEVYNQSALKIEWYCGALKVYTEPYVSRISTDQDGYIFYIDENDKILVDYVGKESVLVLPNDTTKIRHRAFTNCDNLTSVTIPNSVMGFLGDPAFYDCKNLESIIFNGTVAEWDAMGKIYICNYGVPARKVVCLDGEVRITEWREGDIIDLSEDALANWEI